MPFMLTFCNETCAVKIKIKLDKNRRKKDTTYYFVSKNKVNNKLAEYQTGNTMLNFYILNHNSHLKEASTLKVLKSIYV